MRELPFSTELRSITRYSQKDKYGMIPLSFFFHTPYSTPYRKSDDPDPSSLKQSPLLKHRQTKKASNAQFVSDPGGLTTLEEEDVRL